MTAQTTIALTEVTGIILAGGRGSRMGGEDKGLLMLNGQPLYQHVLQRLQPQVATVCISANRNQTRYLQSGFPVIADSIPDYAGPLAGMLAALQSVKTSWALFVSCDTPFIPWHLAQQLWQQRGEASAVWVRNADRDHPTMALIHRQAIEPLEAFLQRGDRKLMLFLSGIDAKPVFFNDDPQCFANINTPGDLHHYQENN